MLVPPTAAEQLNRPPTARGPWPWDDGDTLDREVWSKLADLQRHLLARTAPPVPGYELKLLYRPSFVVTGDYHDFFPRPDGSMGTFVGDGSGHGPPASTLTAIMLTILRTHNIHTDPGGTLARAGALFHKLIPADLFMTGVYLLLEPEGRIQWASAGHHPPLHVTRRGTVTPIDLTVQGPALGPAPRKPYVTVRAQLEPGDRVLLFTDGLSEARNPQGEEFSRFRIGQHMQYTMDDPLAEAIEGLVDAVRNHLKAAPFDDDFTVLGVERVA